MLRLVTDGAGDMPLEWADEYELNIIPINIHFKEKTYLQGVDLSNKDFYNLADTTGVIPKTSQPTPQQFIDFYNRIAEKGDTILSIHITSKLSGTYESAMIAADELKDEYDVLPFDSAAGVAALGYMCKEARLMDRAGASIEAILERMKYIRRNMNIIVALDTLEYARMSGRVGTLQSALASLLNVKPIVVLHDGVLDMTERVRTRQRSLEYVLSMIHQRVGDRLVNAAVVQANDEKAGKLLMDRVRETLNCQELVMTDFSISVAANLGPGTVGIVAYPVKEGLTSDEEI